MYYVGQSCNLIGAAENECLIGLQPRGGTTGAVQLKQLATDFQFKISCSTEIGTAGLWMVAETDPSSDTIIRIQTN